MTRAALYARYSSDNQRDASIEDQLRICREQAQREGGCRASPGVGVDPRRRAQLRIIDDALWQAVKARQAAIAEQHANLIAGVRQAHANNLRALHRPKALLSGLIFCGVCGGPYALRSQARYACSAHVTNGSCTNSRTIRRPISRSACWRV